MVHYSEQQSKFGRPALTSWVKSPDTVCCTLFAIYRQRKVARRFQRFVCPLPPDLGFPEPPDSAFAASRRALFFLLFALPFGGGGPFTLCERGRSDLVFALAFADFGNPASVMSIGGASASELRAFAIARA